MDRPSDPGGQAMLALIELVDETRGTTIPQSVFDLMGEVSVAMTERFLIVAEALGPMGAAAMIRAAMNFCYVLGAQQNEPVPQPKPLTPNLN